MRILGVLFIAMTVIVSPGVLEDVHGNPATRRDETLRLGERRATLEPAFFKDAGIRQAYQIVRDVPWLLDSIYCFCYCEESFQHKSLLSCYVDDHAAM